MQIKTWRDPYDAGFSPTTPTEITINPGLTVLVGCNGAGKTTLLHNIKDVCRDSNTPCHLFDNLSDGGNNAWGFLLGGGTEFEGDDYGLGGLLFSSSEGESIKVNIGRQSTKYKEFLRTGYFKNKSHNFAKIFHDDMPDIVNSNVRILLFDATDSGMSIDAICEIKALFKLVLEDAAKLNLETYIIISANEYELCRNENCFDVNTGKYVTFKDYEDYRKFIIGSRKKKEKRIEKQQIWRDKKKQQEIKTYEKLKAETIEKLNKLKAKYINNHESYSIKWQMDDVVRKFDDFIRHARFNDFESIDINQFMEDKE